MSLGKGYSCVLHHRIAAPHLCYIFFLVIHRFISDFFFFTVFLVRKQQLYLSVIALLCSGPTC